MSNNLTLKQKEFVNQVVETKNPTEAARRAYDLGSKGGKDKNNTARSIASENLTKPAIRESIEELVAEQKITKGDRLKILAGIMKDLKDKRSVIEANKEITKMLGEYEPSKHQIMAEDEALNKVIIKEE